MTPPTNQELNAKREEHCVAVSPERKYYRIGDTWIKRSLRPAEWQKHNGYLYVPLLNMERVLNEGAYLKFLAEKTEILLLKLFACFEDDGAAYLITEYVAGVGMNDLDVEGQNVVAEELQRQLETLKGLTSDTWGGPGGAVSKSAVGAKYSEVLPPYRSWRSRTAGHGGCAVGRRLTSLSATTTSRRITSLSTPICSRSRLSSIGNMQASICLSLKLSFTEDQAHPSR
jgi:hypothetical protein